MDETTTQVFGAIIIITLVCCAFSGFIFYNIGLVDSSNITGQIVTKTQNQTQTQIQTQTQTQIQIQSQIQNTAKNNSQDGYYTHDITLAQLKSFLLDDDTNDYDFTYPTPYAVFLIKNAVSNGYHCGLAYIAMKEGTYVLVAFNTIDKGLVFVDAGGDYIFYNVAVGSYLFPRVDYDAPDYNDTVVSWIIAWEDTIPNTIPNTVQSLGQA
jgi:hypothetical protein